MTFSRLEDFDPNYRSRLGGDIQSFEVYTDSNEPVGRVVDAWVDDIGNIQQLVVDLNASPPGNRIMLPLAQAQIDRATKRIYVSELPQGQSAPAARYQEPLPPRSASSQPASYAPPASNPGYRMASLEESAPLEGYRSPEPAPLASQPPARRVELPPIPPEAYSDQPQPINYAANPPVPPVNVHRETYPQNYTTNQPVPPVEMHRETYAANPPVPPLDVHNAGRTPPPSPRVYESEQPPMQYEEPIPRSEGIHDRTPEHSRVVSEETIPVLEERLVVENHVRKSGEVVVRKEIETEIIEVPIRREKLIIEQVGAEPKQLAEIDLQQDDVSDSELIDRAHEIRQTRKQFD